MTVIRPRPPTDPLELDGAGVPPGPVPTAEALERARCTIVQSLGDLDLARSMLAEYDTCRPESRLFAVLQAAARLRAQVDRVVIVAAGGIGPATRLVAAACCHPCHDQLSRADRGGRPRLSWLDGRSSPDELQGLLDLVAPPGRPPGQDLLDRWTVLAVDSPPDDPGSLAIVRLLRAARGSAGDGCDAPPLVAITRSGSDLDRLAGATAGAERFAGDDRPDAPLGLFTAAGLLPAAIAGIDVVQLLKGAAAMLVRFSEAPVAVNPVLVDAAVSVAAAAAGRPARRFAIDDRSLESLAAWHHWLQPSRLADGGFVTSVEGGAARRAWPATDGFGGFSCGTTAGDAEPAAVTIRLPRIDEHALGQLLQLLALSRAVEEGLRRGV
jgi:hypothetical protein